MSATHFGEDGSIYASSWLAFNSYYGCSVLITVHTMISDLSVLVR